MKLIRIFGAEDRGDGIWSIHFDYESKNEFDLFFSRASDTEWLQRFFVENSMDLSFGFFADMTVTEAGLRTLDEIEELEDVLYNYAELGFKGKYGNLQHIFKPLNNFEYTIATYQKSKVRIDKGWLRIYAIRIDQNCYVITGGAIKLTHDMKRKHLQNELYKLEKVKEFLRDHGITYTEDLNKYHDEQIV